MPKIIASSKGGQNFPPVPSGNHVARCYSMVYVGTIAAEYLGETKMQKKVHLTFELPNEMMIFNPDKGEQPRVISKAFTLSLSEKSTLRPFLESWRAKAFTQGEADGFDIAAVVGAPCMISIIHKQKKDGSGIKADISSVASMPKGTNCPPQINDTVVFSVEEFDQHLFDGFPDWLKDQIRSSVEYKEMQQPEVYHAEPAPENTQFDDNSDLPF